MENLKKIAHPGEDFHEYVCGIAPARYAIRKVFRIIDEQARRAGVEPLEHQALLQIYGTDQQMLHVNVLAHRLDIPAALASRTVTSLQKSGYVARASSSRDRRVTEVSITQSGRELVKDIDSQVRRAVGLFAQELTSAEKWSALRILTFYVGLDVDLDHIREHVKETRS